MFEPEDPPEWAAEREIEAARLGTQFIESGSLGSLPADVSFVRYVDPDERDRLHTFHLRERGLRKGDRMRSASEAKKFAEAMYRLQVMYPVHPRYRQPYNKRQIRVVYDYYVNTLIPCLQGKGYDVGPIPTWEFFYANYTPFPWKPHLKLAPMYSHMPEDEYRELLAECPPRPPIAALFPDD